MNASGYADLLAKIVAGADWIVAEALEVEPIDLTAWEMMHGRLRAWVGSPEKVGSGDSDTVHCLILGLLVRRPGPCSGPRRAGWPPGPTTNSAISGTCKTTSTNGRTPSHGFKGRYRHVGLVGPLRATTAASVG